MLEAQPGDSTALRAALHETFLEFGPCQGVFLPPLLLGKPPEHS